MTSVHPLVHPHSDDTVVQINEINEDGLRSSDQQVEARRSFESNRDQTDHDEIIDKEQTDRTVTQGSKSGELDDDEKIQLQNLTDNNITSASNNSNQFQVGQPNRTSYHSHDSIDDEEHFVAAVQANTVYSSRTYDSQAKSSTNNRTDSGRLSHSSASSSSSSTSSDDGTNEKRRSVDGIQQKKSANRSDRGQPILKPIMNGLTANHHDHHHKSNNKQAEREKFTFTWSNLSYFVYITSRLGMRRKKKYIFNQINGVLKSNQLFGLLGPSGQIKINGKLSKYKMAYIPQHDEYLEDLTCLEILTYASKLKNGSASLEDTLLTLNKELTEQNTKQNQSRNFHLRVAKNVLNLLGLGEQQNTYAGRLSGGQKKRLSIAQELVIKPHIIFLDEPTSGLDSNSSYQCISLLNQLAKQSTPIAIVCTIHQPNLKTLQLFDQIYVLSSYGQVIYNASPLDVVANLNRENIDVPIHYNPADFLLELASGEYGQVFIEKMVDQVKRNEKDRNQHLVELNDEDSKDALKAFAVNITDNFSSQFSTLFSRCWLLTVRNPMLTTNRILSHLLMAFFIGWIFGPDVGKAADCPAKMSLLLDSEEISKLTNHTIESSKNVMDNMSSIFFGILVTLLGSMLPTLVTFPLEVKILQKEYFNGWYGIKAFFYARFIADLPLQIFVPFLYVSITYYLNGQLMEEFRFVNYTLIFVLTAIIAQCHGIIVSAIFSKDIMTAVYLGPITSLPLLLFSGFLVRIERMPTIIRPLTYLRYMRFSFEGIVISVYGFNRCGDEAVEQIQRVRKQLDTYFTNLMGFVQAGINCEDDWDKANVVMMEEGSGTTAHLDSMRLNLSSLNRSIINEASQKLIEAEPENKTDNGINTLFNNLLDVMFNSQLDDNGKIVPRVMQLFDLKDAYLFRTIIALLIFTVLTRIISYYIIKYKATLRG